MSETKTLETRLILLRRRLDARREGEAGACRPWTASPVSTPRSSDRLLRNQLVHATVRHDSVGRLVRLSHAHHQGSQSGRR